MNNFDVRWQQRLYNFSRALLQLDEAMELMQQRELSKLEKQGDIQGFEYCYELGWNTLKDFLVWQGIDGIVGYRDTIREAFSKGLIADGPAWMQMRTVPYFSYIQRGNGRRDLDKYSVAAPSLAQSATADTAQPRRAKRMNLHDSGLSDNDVESIRHTLRLFPKISEAMLYGSRAKGNCRPDSVIDLTL